LPEATPEEAINLLKPDIFIVDGHLEQFISGWRVRKFTLKVSTTEIRAESFEINMQN
jgi:hypothetical protein